MAGNWLVYGKAWWAVTIEADTQDEAEILAQTMLMNEDGLRFMVLSAESELIHG